MKKIIVFIILIIALIIFFICFPNIYTLENQEHITENQGHITENQEYITARFRVYQNLWEIIYSQHKEPFEICFIVTWWGDIYSYTTHEDNQISGISVMIDLLRKSGVEISDIALIMHNHKALVRPSQSNMEIYKRIKNHGFQGAFGIYSNAGAIYIEREGMRKTILLGRKNNGRKG